MQSFHFKFLLLIFLLTTPILVQASVQCMNSNFATNIEDAGIILGKLKSTVGIEKKECDVTIKHIQFEYLETIWKIDICREPVHVKYEKWKKTNVYKRKTSCSQGNKSDYCKSFFELKNLIEDKGLIYAEGRKENLESAHGQISCLYNLVRDYLDRGQIFAVGTQSLRAALKKNEVVVPVQVEETQEVIIETPRVEDAPKVLPDEGTSF